MLLSGSGVYGQKVLIPEINPASSRFDNFLLENGNAEPTTTCVYQDKKGFIWSGTEFGLYRFDGVRYQKYPIGKSDSTLTGYMVLSILEDSEGIIWAGTYKALNRIDVRSGIINHFFPDSADSGSPGNAIRLIHEDRTGLIWLVTDRDIFTFFRKDKSFTRYPVDSLAWRSGHPAVVYEKNRFLEDKTGRIWVATDNGLYLYRREIKDWSRVYPDKPFTYSHELYRITCVEENFDGTILAGTEYDGLIKIYEKEKGLLEISKLKILNGKSDEDSAVSAIFPEAPDKLWLFGNSTLIQLNTLTGEKKSYIFSDQSLPSRKWGSKLPIEKILRCHDGNLWLVSLAGGLLFQFNSRTEYLGLFLVPRYVEFSFINDITGNFWFASVAQNLFRLIIDSLPYMAVTIPNSGFAQIGNMNRISEDSRGDIWLALTEGVYKIKNPDQCPVLKPEKIDIPDKKGKPSSIFYDSKGDFWIGMDSGLILKYNPSEDEFQKFTLPVSAPYEYPINTVVIRDDQKGSIWFATIYHGIYKLANDSHRIEPMLSFYELDANKSAMFLLDFLIDDSDSFWITTDAGVFKTDRNKTKIAIYTESEGIDQGYGNFYARIVQDNEKKIWILNTFSGAYLFDNKNNRFTGPHNLNLIPFLGFLDLLFDTQGKIWVAEYGRISVTDPISGKIRKFDLPVKTGELQSYKLCSGRIAYIANNKLFIFPREIPENNSIPRVYLTGLSVNGKSYNTIFPERELPEDLKSIELRYDQNNLVFEFAALNYNRPELNSYRYFMNGIDKDTMLTGSGSPVEYKQLAPGKYSFWVTGSNNDGIWNRSGVTMQIDIRPPLYKSRLAYALYIMFLVLIITAYIRFRTYSLQKDKSRLEDEVRARTSDLENKNRQLAEIDRIKTHFFTDISHEIRTPLTLITGPLETISREITLSDRFSDLVEIMKRNSQRLMQLVDQLLDISRLDAGKMVINLAEDNILKCLKILVYEFLSFAESKQIKYVVELPEKGFVALLWSFAEEIFKTIMSFLKAKPISRSLKVLARWRSPFPEGDAIK